MNNRIFSVSKHSYWPVSLNIRFHSFFRRVVFLPLIGLLWCSLGVASEAHHAGAKEMNSEPIRQAVTAGGRHEECALVRQHHRLAYQFSSSAEMEFNLHFHSADKADVTYLFGPAAVRHHPVSNSYVAPSSMVICFMWENKSAQTVHLDYSFSVIPAEG